MDKPRTGTAGSEHRRVAKKPFCSCGKLTKHTLYFQSWMTNLCIGALWLMLGMSCDRMELTRSVEEYDIHAMTEDSAKIDDQSGISFELDSDSLEEEIENIYFESKEWEDEKMNAHL